MKLVNSNLSPLMAFGNLCPALNFYCFDLCSILTKESIKGETFATPFFPKNRKSEIRCLLLGFSTFDYHCFLLEKERSWDEEQGRSSLSCHVHTCFLFFSFYVYSFFCLFWKDIHFLSSNNLICLIIFDMASLD